MSLFGEYVSKYGGGSEGFTGIKLSHGVRNWIPIRFCAEDWILAVWVYNFNRDRFNIGLFLHADHTKFKKDSGLRAALGMCLTEAFNQLGKMELHFVGSRETPTLETGFEHEIPEDVRRLASELGVKLSYHDKIDHEEGRAIYLRLVGFSDQTIHLFGTRGVDLIQAAFVVQRAIWSKAQVEYLAKECLDSAALFEGGKSPENRLSFLRDLWSMRIAIMSERFDTLLTLGANSQPVVDSQVWSNSTTQEFQLRAETTLHDVNGKALTLSAGQSLCVSYLPVSANEMSSSRFPQKKGVSHIIVVTREWERVPNQAAKIKEAAKQGCRIIKIVDSLGEIDFDIGNRLGRSVSTKRALPERPEA